MEKLGNITLYNADCMEIMKSFTDKQFDICIVDPPYGIDINKSGRLTKEKGRSYKSWDLKTPDEKYFDELLERIKTIRVSERMAYQKITDLFNQASAVPQ